MKDTEQRKIKALIKKYNPILKESIKNALTEDLFNLIIVNGEDKGFELKELLREKDILKTYIMLEFIRLNNRPITSELKNMKEIKINLVRSKQGKLKL